MSLIKQFTLRQLEDEVFRAGVQRMLGDTPGHEFHGNQYTHEGKPIISKSEEGLPPDEHGQWTKGGSHTPAWATHAVLVSRDGEWQPPSHHRSEANALKSANRFLSMLRANPTTKYAVRVIPVRTP